MKLDYEPQAGLRRRRPGHGRERAAFWGGIAIVVAFEVILMSKTWSELPVIPFDLHWRFGDAAQAATPDDPDVAPLPSGPN